MICTGCGRPHGEAGESLQVRRLKEIVSAGDTILAQLLADNEELREAKLSLDLEVQDLRAEVGRLHAKLVGRRMAA